MFDLIVIILQFISGSIMFSYILARSLGVDLSKIRDGNPGSTNLWRAKGIKWGIIALLLDYFKGTFPLFLFLNLKLINNKYTICIAALAGIAGHAFSPMLKFKGGKAVATTFGAWSVLTTWQGPVILGGVFTLFSIFKRKTTIEDDAIRVLIGFLALIPFVMYMSFSARYDLLIFYIGNLAIISYKHWINWRKFFQRNISRCKFL
ncbi:MAG TPA: glycerol-3-phosphate acyltransferase [Pseudothermotoga sp.]